MPRDQSVRNRIVEHLAQHGAVVDSSGKATSVLKEAIAYEGTDAGFTQVVAAMAKAGLLNRQIRGKRTYRISHSGAAHGGNGVVRAVPGGGEAGREPMDYDELASALLAEVARRRRRHRPMSRSPPPGRVAGWSNSRPATLLSSATWRAPTRRRNPSRPSETSFGTSSMRPSTTFRSSPNDSKNPVVPTREERPNASGPTSRRC